MLHSTIVSSEYAEETSTKAVRHRGTQVVPKGSYSFGDAELLPGSCMTIQPQPVKQVIRVHQSAVAPNSLPGGALPRDTALMPTGEMRGLGEPLAPVPMAFRHGVASSRRSILGDKDVRKIGSSLVAMAPVAADYERNPISQDKPYLNRSAGGAAVVPNYGMAPDDRIRQKLIRPSTPGPIISREPMPIYQAPGQVTDARARYELRTSRSEPGVIALPSVQSRSMDMPRQDSRVSRYHSIRGIGTSTTPSRVLANSIASGVGLGVGVAVLGVAAAGIYWFTRS